MTLRGGVVHERARSGPSSATSRATRSDETLPRTRTGSALGAELLGGLLGRLVVLEVADADPRAARTGGALEMLILRLQRLVGRRGARNLSQPGLVRGSRPFLGLRGRVPEPVEELGLPRRSGEPRGSRQVFDELDDRARSW